MLVLSSAPSVVPATVKLVDQQRPILPRAISAQALTTFLDRTRASQAPSGFDAPLLTPFEITARAKGQSLVSEWFEGQSPFRAMQHMLSAMPTIDLVQLVIVTDRQDLFALTWQAALNAEKNGRYALELTQHGEVQRVSPLETIATNRPLRRWFEIQLERKKLSAAEFFALGGKLSLLTCRQFLLPCQQGAEAVETYRGSRLIAADAPVEQLADDVVSGIARWFMANAEDDGSLPYKYWPSAGMYSDADNTIRRFMASVVFNRLADGLDRQDVRVAAKKNLNFNLKRFYTTVNGHGAILWNDSVKLGAVAIAAQAIIESPFATEWRDQLAALRETIDALWQPSGAFRTFLIPKDRNDNQNFYPGEALVFWATSLAKNPDDALLARTLKSLSFYRNHFRTKPNPAFVPWHTQAAAIIFRLTGDAQWRDYIFEMNDWLLQHQEYGGTVEPDYWGRFYSPHKPEYGPPHASATGVYLEGLVDAWLLAREAGDDKSSAAYLQAIKRGIRSMAQLQFSSALDCYYISRKQRVMGAIRTESDNNEIRIDNMQHALAALLKFKTALRN